MPPSTGGCAAFLNNPRSKFAQMTAKLVVPRRLRDAAGLDGALCITIPSAAAAPERLSRVIQFRRVPYARSRCFSLCRSMRSLTTPSENRIGRRVSTQPFSTGDLAWDIAWRWAADAVRDVKRPHRSSTSRRFGSAQRRHPDDACYLLRRIVEHVWHDAREAEAIARLQDVSLVVEPQTQAAG
jgi:hypothetical protein